MSEEYHSQQNAIANGLNRPVLGIPYTEKGRTLRANPSTTLGAAYYLLVN